jgi:hypothetical protein
MMMAQGLIFGDDGAPVAGNNRVLLSPMAPGAPMVNRAPKSSVMDRARKGMAEMMTAESGD